MEVGFLTERMLPGLGVDRLVYEYSKNLKKFDGFRDIHRKKRSNHQKGN